LLALTVIGNVRYKPDRTILMGGKQILLFLGGRGAGGKANQGGLPALTVACKIQ